MAETPKRMIEQGYSVTIYEWDREDADEVVVTCESPLPREIHVGDTLMFTVTQIKRVTIERRTT